MIAFVLVTHGRRSVKNGVLEECMGELVSTDVIDELADRVAQAAAVVDAATHELLTRIRAFDESGGWYVQGATSCAAWLAWRIGLTPGVAREKVRVARKLAALPATDEQLRLGQISYWKTRALTRVATAESEQTLLLYAQHSTGRQFEKICRLYRQSQALGVPPDRAIDR